MVSIHGPLGYGPSTLPLRHSAFLDKCSKESLLEWTVEQKRCCTRLKMLFRSKTAFSQQHWFSIMIQVTLAPLSTKLLTKKHEKVTFRTEQSPNWSFCLVKWGFILNSLQFVLLSSFNRKPFLGKWIFDFFIIARRWQNDYHFPACFCTKVTTTTDFLTLL